MSATPTSAFSLDLADVAIVGGGLAGLTLAIHLRQRNPDLSIHVIERREHPVREAAFKVGESTVEIGAHYLSEVLGFREHLDTCHLRKFGFRFFFSDKRADVDRCTEIGVSRVLPTPSWQIDRGRFENFLAGHARELGVQLHGGAVVRQLELGEATAPHRVAFEQGGRAHHLSARWLVDASGRAGLLKRKLGLARKNEHDANAVWWRVAGHVDPQNWSEDAEWLQRCDPPDRWRSTNHMCGPGYWVWLIPLSSGSHSIGIVCDAKMHPIETMNSHDKAMQWLALHQPKVAEALADSRHQLQDFMFLRDYSYDCAQVFSDQRWAITGEAGVFLDPFYSPGTDFIAIANTYICDLVERDRAGSPIAARAQVYQQLFASFYENTLPLYQDQYALFGDAQVMPLKVIWDYTYYWALLSPLFFAGRLTDISVLSRLREPFALGRKLNLEMQALFAESARRPPRDACGAGRLLDQREIDWFHEMNRALTDIYDSAAFEALIVRNVERMQSLAVEITARAPFATAPTTDPPTALLDASWYTEAV
ncbi:MAG: NAD(P)/FAD-dependent oxidoreductase [Burkholderiales bacterium]